MESDFKGLSFGVERTVDNLGRIVLPKEMRNKLDFSKNQVVNIKLLKNCIQIEKSVNDCSLCGKENEILNYKEKHICKDCVDGIINEFNK